MRSVQNLDDMVKSRALILGFVVLAFCKCGGTTRALTIETQFIPEGKIINGVGVAEAPPSNTVGGGNLQSIVRAAADLWESLIDDQHTVTLTFGWTNTGAGSNIAFHQGLSAQGEPRRERLGSLAFNSRYSSAAPFYLDPTPWVNEEFVVAAHEFADLGGGLVEVRREYQATNPTLARSKDMLSVAIHEIGHALGIAMWAPFAEETIEDGAIDIVAGPFIGTSVPTHGAHLAVPRANMTNEFHPLGRRLDVTQVDLLAVCQVSQFGECDLSVRELTPVGDGNGDNDVDGADFLAWQSSQSPNALHEFDLHDWSDSYGSPLREFGDFNHDRQFAGEDFLDWQRGASPTPMSEVDLDRWAASYGSIRYADGDFDQDYRVTGKDFLSWQRGRSPSVGSSSDLAMWRNAYRPALNSFGALQVPEPVTATLLVTAVSVALLSRTATNRCARQR